MLHTNPPLPNCTRQQVFFMVDHRNATHHLLFTFNNTPGVLKKTTRQMLATIPRVSFFASSYPGITF
jgi:hypothetical protein